jgi:pyruvate kinase
MSRHTKIVATLGPASTSTEVLERLLRAGVDVVRLNFSHGTSGDHLERAASVREIARRLGRTVGILGDLQGPKIRVGKFETARSCWSRARTSSFDAKCELGQSGARRPRLQGSAEGRPARRRAAARRRPPEA